MSNDTMDFWSEEENSQAENLKNIKGLWLGPEKLSKSLPKNPTVPNKLPKVVKNQKMGWQNISVPNIRRNHNFIKSTKYLNVL